MSELQAGAVLQSRHRWLRMSYTSKRLLKTLKTHNFIKTKTNKKKQHLFLYSVGIMTICTFSIMMF